MDSLPSFLTLAHLVGLALGVGAATAKLRLLARCRSDPGFLPSYLAVVRPLTRLIVVGLALLTLSGVGWLLLGYPFSRLLVVKLVLVGAIWVLGPVIDNVVEPKFRRLAPSPGEAASPEFVRARNLYLRVEATATGLFYVIVAIWVLI